MRIDLPVLQRRRLRREAARVESVAERLRDLGSAALAAATAEVRAALRLGRAVCGDVPTALLALAHAAVLAEATLGLRPRAEQLQAALAMYRGRVVWLSAGRGKSLALALVAVLHAWSGRPCRVTTSTAYLARRDSERLRPLFTGCGLSLACVTEAGESGSAYVAEVIYASAKQLLVDSLREQVIHGAVDDPLRMRLRGLAVGAAPMPTRATVLVDDADLVMIEEATSPLVVSAPGDNPLLLEALLAAREVVAQLQESRDYQHLASKRDIRFTPAGLERLETLGEQLPGIWHEPERRDDLIRQSIAVRDLLQNGRHYRVEAGRVVVLDDGIGRILVGRGWAYGLVQAIEACEGLALTTPSRTLARMSFTRFFHRHASLCAIGRGYRNADAALREVYGLDCLRLSPRDTAAPIAVQACKDRDDKLDAVAAAAARLHADRQPVLIVIRRGGDGEALMRHFAERLIDCDQLVADTLSDDLLDSLVEPGRVSMVQSAVLHGIAIPASSPGTAPLQILLAEAHDLAHADQRLASLSSAGTSLFVAPDDELFLQQIPQLTAVLQRDRLSPGVMRSLLRLAQMRAARVARKQGKLLIKRDTMLNQQLAFTGDQDVDLGIYAFVTQGRDET